MQRRLAAWVITWELAGNASPTLHAPCTQCNPTCICREPWMIHKHSVVWEVLVHDARAILPLHLPCTKLHTVNSGTPSRKANSLLPNCPTGYGVCHRPTDRSFFCNKGNWAETLHPLLFTWKSKTYYRHAHQESLFLFSLQIIWNCFLNGFSVLPLFPYRLFFQQ